MGASGPSKEHRTVPGEGSLEGGTVGSALRLLGPHSSKPCPTEEEGVIKNVYALTCPRPSRAAT